MIEPGDGWRFREHLLDIPLLQDQVVEHVLTGHLAVRRVYSDEVCRDEQAVGALRDQIAHSAAIHHPGLQRLYQVETLNNRLALTAEFVQGTPLKTLTLAHQFKTPARWAAHARVVLRLLRALSREGLAIDRVRLADLVFSGGVLRIAAHQPVSPHLRPEDSPLLASLRQVPTGGVYARSTSAPRPNEWKHLMTMLYFMASGQVDRDIPAAYEFFTKQPHSHSHLGVEAPIENLLLRYRDESDPEAAWHWDDLLSAIELMIRGGDKHGAPAKAFTVAAPPPPSSPSSRHKVSESEESSEQVRFTLKPVEKPPPDPVVVAPPPQKTFQEMAESESRSSSAAVEKPVAMRDPTPTPVESTGEEVATGRRSREEVYTRDEMRMPGTHGIDDDAEEDRTYLYPTASSSAEAVKKTGTAAVSKRKRLIRRRYFVIAGAAIGLVVLVAIAIPALGPLNTPRSTNLHQPVAAIAPITGTFAAYDPIILDGTASSDADGDSLRYNWSIPSLRHGEQYRILPNNSLQAARTELKVYVEGEHTVQLEVFDLAYTSPPATTTVRIGRARGARP